MTPHPSVRLAPDRPWRAALLLPLLLSAWGCEALATPPPTAGPPAATATPSATPLSPGPGLPSRDGQSPGGAIPPQTETDWGPIWDALPASFPRPPGAVPAEMREGPASAVLAIPATIAPTATLMQAALERARYSTEALSGPFEDGSIVIDSVGPTPDCRVQTRLVPLGDTTVMTVMFGTGCPFS